jgi:hypothetical protein
MHSDVRDVTGGVHAGTYARFAHDASDMHGVPGVPGVQKVADGRTCCIGCSLKLLGNAVLKY